MFSAESFIVDFYTARVHQRLGKQFLGFFFGVMLFVL